MVTLFNVFPNLQTEGCTPSSPATPNYNCIAWAAGDSNRFWWPLPENAAYWPTGIPREETIDAFVAAYGALGYEPCDSGEQEENYEKIALYAKGVEPAHAARQLPNGNWTSKLGQGIDIEHSLNGLEGSFYGQVIQFLRRPI
jgi:hypothetical protein